MALIDQAADLDPAGRDWDEIRRQIRHAQQPAGAAAAHRDTDARPPAEPTRPAVPPSSPEQGHRDQRHQVSRMLAEGQALRAIGEAVAGSRHDMWHDEHGQHIPDPHVGTALAHHAREALSARNRPGIVHNRGVRISFHHVNTDRIEIQFTADDHKVAQAVTAEETGHPDRLRALVEDLLHHATERGNQLVTEATAAARALTVADHYIATADASPPAAAALATSTRSTLDQPTNSTLPGPTVSDPDTSTGPRERAASSSARLAFQRPPREAVATDRPAPQAAEPTMMPVVGGPARTAAHQRR